MSRKHWELILKIITSNIQPHFDKILKEKRKFHTFP